MSWSVSSFPAGASVLLVAEVLDLAEVDEVADVVLEAVDVDELSAGDADCEPVDPQEARMTAAAGASATAARRRVV